jgi:subtilisin-like proprotein convertase family protein
MGTLARIHSLGTFVPITVTQVFANVSPITINDLTNATPYPSTINVAGVTNAVTKVTVSINGLTHSYPSDIDLFLVNPVSQSCMLMSSCGGGSGITGVNLTFDNAAAQYLPASLITSGTYRPTDRYTNIYNTNLNALITAPNGAWSLYVDDFGPGDTGNISSGWSVRFITSNAIPACCSILPPTTFTSTVWSNNTAQLTWSAVPGPNYQVQFRTNLTLGTWENLGGLIPGTNSTLGVTDVVPGVPIRFYRVVTLP